jgi:hypothetical protein
MLVSFLNMKRTLYLVLVVDSITVQLMLVSIMNVKALLCIYTEPAGFSLNESCKIIIEHV